MEDTRMVESSVYNDPFGWSGGGAPNVLPDGHVNTTWTWSLEKDQFDTTKQFPSPFQDTKQFEMTIPKTTWETQGGSTLNLMSWSEREQNRKKREKEEWLWQLEDAKNDWEKRDKEWKAKEREEDLRLEMKIHHDLEKMKREFEEENARIKSRRDANVAVARDAV